MTLSRPSLQLKPILVRDRTVLALDTGFSPDSLEGLRLVKASRGTGWLWQGGVLTPWTTQGVSQDNERLLVWGALDLVPEGTTPAFWPREGEAGQTFLTAFVHAWTARAAEKEPLSGFSPSSVVPYLTDSGWAFVFLPDGLRMVLDSLQPFDQRLVWDAFRQPDTAGAPSWAFASAALAVDQLTGTLPWAQDDEEHQRQEIRAAPCRPKNCPGSRRPTPLFYSPRFRGPWVTRPLPAGRLGRPILVSGSLPWSLPERNAPLRPFFAGVLDANAVLSGVGEEPW